jgi:D-alanyl-D-alanine dipeptidase
LKTGLLVVLAACTASAAPAKAVSPVGDATQLVTTVVDDWSSTTGVMRTWHRDGSAWIADGSGWSVVIGKSGAAWGRGLHGDAALTKGPVKKEGDGAAPAGAFALRGAYGYGSAAPQGTQLPYAQLAESTECVDDPRSKHYTQILARGSAADWHSSEHMRRSDELYTWVIDIAHNPAAARGAGSCIFFHVWHDATTPTVGCTAMPEPRLAALLAHLAPSAVYVLLPRAAYKALAPAWGLPAQDASAKVSP